MIHSRLPIHLLLLALLWVAGTRTVSARHDSGQSVDTAPDQSLTPQQQEDRRELALHCIAVEKDGVAIDPWIFLHGADGRRKAGLFTPRTSWSFQGGGIKNYPRTGRSLFPESAWRAEAEAGPYNPLRACIQQMFARAKQRGLRPLVFVHGGNNALDGAIERAEKLCRPAEGERISESEKAGYYPIFLCWNSAIPSTWGESIVHVRNGVDVRARDPIQEGAYGWLLAPLYLATDLASGVVHAPQVGIDNLISTMRGTPAISDRTSPDHRDASRRYLSLRARENMQADKYAPAHGIDPDGSGRAAAVPLQDYEEKLGMRVASDPAARQKFAKQWEEHWLEQRQKILTRKPLPPDYPAAWGTAPLVVSMGEFRSTPADYATRQLGWWVGLPAKAAVLTALTGGGERMWGMMNRRVDTMFYHTSSFSRRRDISRGDTTDEDLAEGGSTGVGAASVFFRSLERAQRDHRAASALLVGHSMGAIVLNRALALFPDLEAKQIVYLAPACSISDFSLLAGPYLRSHPRTQFYNLTLNPYAEKRERSIGDAPLGELLPRGSLLVWIDDFLQHPRSFQDRTFGQFENAMLASLLFHPRIQGQIHICALEAVPTGSVPLPTQAKRAFFTQYAGPTHHGDFSNYRFWEAGFITQPGWVSRERFHLELPLSVDSSVSAPGVATAVRSPTPGSARSGAAPRGESVVPPAKKKAYDARQSPPPPTPAANSKQKPPPSVTSKTGKRAPL